MKTFEVGLRTEVTAGVAELTRSRYSVMAFYESGEGYGAHIYKVECPPDEESRKLWAPELVHTIQALCENPSYAIHRAKVWMANEAVKSLDPDMVVREIL